MPEEDRITVPALESPTELFSLYRAGTTGCHDSKVKKKMSSFQSASPYAEEITQATLQVETYQPASTKETYRSAVGRFLEYINEAKIQSDAFLDGTSTDDILAGFFVARIGRITTLAKAIGWRAVLPATAKTEVCAIIALLRTFGLPTPAFSSLNLIFQKCGANRKTPTLKLPLFSSQLELLWNLPETKINGIFLRNTALCVTTYFFLLRGKEARTLQKNQLERLKPSEKGEETWRVTLTHSKTDPLILGQLPHGGSWSGFSSNTFLLLVLIRLPLQPSSIPTSGQSVLPV